MRGGGIHLAALGLGGHEDFGPVFLGEVVPLKPLLGLGICTQRPLPPHRLLRTPRHWLTLGLNTDIHLSEKSAKEGLNREI